MTTSEMKAVRSLRAVHELIARSVESLDAARSANVRRKLHEESARLSASDAACESIGKETLWRRIVRVVGALCPRRLLQRTPRLAHAI